MLDVGYEETSYQCLLVNKLKKSSFHFFDRVLKEIVEYLDHQGPKVP